MSGLFKSMKKELGGMASDISKGLDEFSGGKSSPTLDLFKTGNVVQLISRSSGKTLQLVMSPYNAMVVDGLGPEGPNFYHAHFTVVNEGNNIVRLHNQNNFLAIVNGATVIIPNAPLTGAETKFRLGQTGQFITIESFTEHGRHIGILPSGELKSALATGREIDAQYGVRLIYTPYQAAPVAKPKK